MTEKDSPLGATRSNRKRAKRDRSWSLLMVGDHGQIIPFRRVKGIAIALITLATLAILAAVGLGLWAGWLRVQNAGLQTELKAVQESAQHLKDEKDLLMARVVILETQTQKNAPVAKPDKEVPKATAAERVAEKRPVEKPPVVAEKPAKAVDIAPQRAEKAPSAPAPSPATIAPDTAKAPVTKVAVSAFIADHRPRNNTLSARFQIKNAGPRGKKISGRCVLVLKNAVKSDMEWVSVPHVSLIGGRPNGKQGRAFRIANFMTMKMQTQRVPDNFAFETGTLYVFDNAGKQLLEKEVPVQLSYRKPAPRPAPAPTPAATQPRVEPSQPRPPAADQPPAAGKASEVVEEAPGPAENVAPAVPVVVPAAPPAAPPASAVEPVVPESSAPGTVTPQPTTAPVDIPEPAAPAPDQGSEDPTTTGSEATPTTQPPPEPGSEDAR